MKIFSQHPLSDFLAQRRQAVVRAIQSEPQDRLLNVNEADYVQYLVDKHHLEPVTFAFDSTRAACAEKLIPAENHPPGFRVQPGKSYPRRVITLHVPFTGEPDLLQCSPSTRISWTYDVTLLASEIQFDLINWCDDREALHRDKKQIFDNITQQNAHLTDEVIQFNSRLEDCIRQTLSARKSALLIQLDLAGSLGIPADVPPTVAIPIVPKKLVVKPSVPASALGTLPDPTLDDETYQDILGIIHTLGVAMERHPSIYLDKHEQHLRDIFLATLCTHYPSSTGETFNKNGRTDILVRHDGSNAFVAECKFWSGLKIFHSTIDQLLGYLTWRDSKAALINFVQETQIAPILGVIATGAPRHPCYIRLESKQSESWMQYEFKLPTDPGRTIHLTVLTFHFPAPPRRPPPLVPEPQFPAPRRPAPS